MIDINVDYAFFYAMAILRFYIFFHINECLHHCFCILLFAFCKIFNAVVVVVFNSKCLNPSRMTKHPKIGEIIAKFFEVCTHAFILIKISEIRCNMNTVRAPS